MRGFIILLIVVLLAAGALHFHDRTFWPRVGHGIAHMLRGGSQTMDGDGNMKPAQ